MALTKTSAAITQLTASGTSTTLNCASSYKQTLNVHHSNGSGSVTGAATFTVQIQVNGAARWYTLGNQPFTCSTTTGGGDDFTVKIPDDTTAVRIVYTQPTGPTGFTLDAEIGLITAL